MANLQKKYWDRKINEWSHASYNKQSKISFVEKIATFFRSVNKRKDAAILIVGKQAKGKCILDLGCGLGEFTFEILKHSPKKILAYDISQVAIRHIKTNVKKNKLNNKIACKVVDASKLKSIPQCDMVIGLGFIDYFTPSELKHLFKIIGTKPYLFSFFEKKVSLFNLLHKIYITIQNCPGAYKYSRQEIESFIPKKSAVYFFEKDGLQFMSNSRKFAFSK